MKVSELQDGLLDYWVGRILGSAGVDTSDPTTWPVRLEHGVCWKASVLDADNSDGRSWRIWSPSTHWHEGGPLIERFNVRVNPPGEIIFAHGPDGCRFPRTETWAAAVVGESHGRGEAHHPLLAVCRAIVASVYGESVNAYSD